MKTLTFLCCVFLALVVSAADDHGGVTAEVLVQSDRSWDGSALPAYPDEPAQVSVLKVVIPPHTSLKWHKHPSINAGYMVSGELTVFSENGATLQLKAGDGIIELVDTWHYGRNDGKVPVEIVVVYVGVKGRPLAIIREESDASGN